MSEDRRMTVGEILSKALNLYRENFGRWVLIVVFVRVPVWAFGWGSWIAGTALKDVVTPPAGGGRGDSTATGWSWVEWVTWLGGLLVAICASGIMNGALTKSVSEAYVGNGMGVRGAYRWAWGKVGRLVGAWLVVAVVVAGGFVALVVLAAILQSWFGVNMPAVVFVAPMVTGGIFWLWFAVTVPAIVVEGLGVRGAMGRSRFLSRGNLGRLFVLTLVVAMVGWGGSYGLSKLTVGLVERVAAEGSRIVESCRSSAAMMWVIVVMPWSAAAYTLMYYDLRVRKEGGVSNAEVERGEE